MFTNSSIAYFPFMNVMPMMVTNIGYPDMQLTPIEPYQDQLSSIWFNGPAQQTWGTAGFTDSPYMNVDLNAIQANAAAQAEQTLAPIYAQKAAQNIHTAKAVLNNAISGYKSKLVNATDEQKEIIKKAVEALEAKKKELEDLEKDTEMAPGERYPKARALKEAIDDIIKETNAKLLGKKTTSSSETPTTGETSETEAEQGTQSGSTSETSENEETSNQGSEVKNIDDFSEMVQEDVTKFFDAVNGMGTKNTEMGEVIADNVEAGSMLELMLCWNENYSSVNNESFIEAFMDDADHAQAREYLPQIVNSLVKRAKAEGVYDKKFKACVDALNKEIYAGDAWGWFGGLRGMDDDIVCQNIDKMVKILATRTHSEFGSPVAKPKEEKAA